MERDSSACGFDFGKNIKCSAVNSNERTYEIDLRFVQFFSPYYQNFLFFISNKIHLTFSMSRKLIILCIMFKIIAFFMITLLARLYVRVVILLIYFIYIFLYNANFLPFYFHISVTHLSMFAILGSISQKVVSLRLIVSVISKLLIG